MASEVEFHTGVADPVGFVCRLLRKACRQGARVLCTAPPGLLVELDRALWTFDAHDFVPHVRMPGARTALAERTPIWLATESLAASAGRVLVNVGAAAPVNPADFARLIEVVAADEGEAQAGRARWRAYKSAGLDIVHHGAGAVRES
jgi:DNA polymerase-3 subunit chi